LKIAFYVHLFKLPAFVSLGLPLALLMAGLIVFGDLSLKNEITAFRTFGISLIRLYAPILIISLLLSFIMFIFHELVVPPANFKAATLLEREWDVDRSGLAKYNKKDIIYVKQASNHDESDLDFLFFARQFKDQKMHGVTLIKYKNNHFSEIIISKYATWDGYYDKINSFEELPISLAEKLLDYVGDHRDHREMNIFELYNRLDLIKQSGSVRHVRQLKFSIQERYALPFSCLTFAFLGSSMGITLRGAGKVNNFGLATVIIFVYYTLQFLSQSLAMVGAISVFLGVWTSNLLGLLFSCWLIKRSQ
jgi:lipopolysaccharide export system permease protein